MSYVYKNSLLFLRKYKSILIRRLIWLKIFLKAKKGSITIEASIIFGLFVLLIMLIADVGSVLLMKERIDRVSYNLASIIRERNILYNGAPLDEKQIDDLYTIAKNFTKETFSVNDNLSIKVEMVEFDNSNKITANPSKTLEFQRGSVICNTQDKSMLNNIAVYTPVSQWTTIYRVSVCAKPISNFYSKTNLATNIIPMDSSAVVYAR